MKRRLVILSIEDITRLFKDYVGQVGFPVDAMPIKFLLNAQERKLGMVVESDEWAKNMPPEEIKFDLRRVYGVS